MNIKHDSVQLFQQILVYLYVVSLFISNFYGFGQFRNGNDRLVQIFFAFVWYLTQGEEKNFIINLWEEGLDEFSVKWRCIVFNFGCFYFERVSLFGSMNMTQIIVIVEDEDSYVRNLWITHYLGVRAWPLCSMYWLARHQYHYVTHPLTVDCI